MISHGPVVENEDGGVGLAVGAAVGGVGVDVGTAVGAAVGGVGVEVGAGVGGGMQTRHCPLEVLSSLTHVIESDGAITMPEYSAAFVRRRPEYAMPLMVSSSYPA